MLIVNGYDGRLNLSVTMPVCAGGWFGIPVPESLTEMEMEMETLFPQRGGKRGREYRMGISKFFPEIIGLGHGNGYWFIVCHSLISRRRSRKVANKYVEKDE